MFGCSQKLRLLVFLQLALSSNCLRVETNALDASGPAGLLFSQSILFGQTGASFLLFTGANKFLETKGDGVYAGRTFSGVTAGRIDAAVTGRTLVGLNSADAIGYVAIRN